MEEGVRCSDNFLLFLSGDPDMMSDDGKGKEAAERKAKEVAAAVRNPMAVV